MTGFGSAKLGLELGENGLMSDPRRVVVLGSTGSIGRQALEVMAAHPDLYRPVALVAGSDAGALQAQVRETGAEHSGLGAEAAAEMSALREADVVLNAVVGAAGLRASVSALEAGKTLALANKESLVAGGEVCLKAMRAGGGKIVPVDSEHAAIAQCLADRPSDVVARIVLTASGGPFRTRQDLDGVTREEALAHPTWTMGPKVTIDSATLMNKGLEVIEAHHLFGVGYDRIDVLIHPQSIVHGIVHLTDGSSLLHAAPADMRIPIAAALAWPEHSAWSAEPIDLAATKELLFEPVDPDRWELLTLAREVGLKGATYPAALNAANEVAVHAFLADQIAFDRIAHVVASVVESHEPSRGDDLSDVLEADAWARKAAQQVIEELV